MSMVRAFETSPQFEGDIEALQVNNVYKLHETQL